MDASDVAKLLLALVFVLDGLGQPELESYNRQQARPRDRVREPFRPIIGAINAYLHAYHMYRAEALRMPEIELLSGRNQCAPSLHHLCKHVFWFALYMTFGLHNV